MRLLLFILLLPFVCAAQTIQIVNPHGNSRLGVQHNVYGDLANGWPLQCNTLSGTVNTWAWSKVSGPACSFSSTNTQSTTVYYSGGVGTYVIRVTVNNGVTADYTFTAEDFTETLGRTACRVGAPQVHVLPSQSGQSFTYTNLRNTHGVLGGDTIKIPKRTGAIPDYYRLQLANFGGDSTCPVVIVPNIVIWGDTTQAVTWGGPNFMSGGTQFAFGSNDTAWANGFKIVGNYRGVEYGFKSTYYTRPTNPNPSATFGFVGGEMRDFDISGCKFINLTTGVKVRMQSDSSAPSTLFNMMNFGNKNKIHNVFMSGSGAEGFYIGTTAPNGGTQAGVTNDGPPIRGHYVEIYNNIVLNSGWDPIQVSVFYNFDVHDNIIHNAAISRQSGQAYFGVMGGLTQGNWYNNAMNRGILGLAGTPYGTVNVKRNFINYVIARSHVTDSANQYHYICKTSHTSGDATEPGVGANWATYWQRREVGEANNDWPTWVNVTSYQGGKGPSNIQVSGDANNFYEGPYIQKAQFLVRKNILAGIDSSGVDISGGSNTRASTVDSNTIVSDYKTISQLVKTSTATSSTVQNNNIIPLLGVDLEYIGNNNFKFMVDSVAIDTFNTAEQIISKVEQIVSGEEENIPPTAVAGEDQTIDQPTSQVTLDGSASYDVGGTIVSYLWEKLSGPSCTITSPSSATTTVTAMNNTGTYVFRLTVTDDRSDTGQDTVTITVNAQPPTPKPSITFPGGKIILFP